MKTILRILEVNLSIKTRKQGENVIEHNRDIEVIECDNIDINTNKEYDNVYIYNGLWQGVKTCDLQRVTILIYSYYKLFDDEIEELKNFCYALTCGYTETAVESSIELVSTFDDMNNRLFNVGGAHI